MAAPESTALPAAPSRADDGETFAAKADAFVGALEPFRQQLQEQADFVDLQITEFDSNLNQAVADATQTAVDASATAQASAATATQAESNAETYRSEAQDARDSALAVVNFAGKWSDLAGALNNPATVFHNGAYWNLLNDLGDVTASEPANDNGDWLFVYTNAELRRKLLDEATLYADFVNGDYRLYEGVSAGVVRGKAFSDLFTYARNSSAFGLGAGGLEEVVVDTPRFVYSPESGKRLGLLSWGPRTNLLSHSQTLDNSVWVKQSSGLGSLPIVTPNAAVAPDGGLADQVDFELNGGTTTSDFSQLQHDYQPASAKHALSIYGRVVGQSSKTFSLVGPGGGQKTVEITPDWRRLTDVGTGVGKVRLRLRGSEGTSDSASVYLWGAQLEQAPYPSDYIKTDTAQVTRDGESCSRTLAGEIGDRELTIYSEFQVSGLEDTLRQGIICLVNAALDSWLLISVDLTGVIRISMRADGGTPYNDNSPFPILIGQPNKVALSIEGGLVRVSLNGSPVFSVNHPSPLPFVSEMRLGRFDTNPAWLNGSLGVVAALPVALTAQQLSSITQPEVAND